MADHIQLEFGAKPWQAAHEALPETVLHRYSVPLVGLIDQNGVKYVFWCVLGQVDPANVWAYSLVTSPEVDRLKEATSSTDLATVLREVTRRRGVVVALANDERGILFDVSLDPGMTYGDSPERAVMALKDKIEAAQSGMHAVEAGTPALA